MNEEQRSYGAGIDGGARYPQPDPLLRAPQALAGNADATGMVGPTVARVIQIEPVNHGYVVTINCQKFAVESKEALLHRLGQYLGVAHRIDGCRGGCPAN